jgi:hypothetical protein
MDSKKGYWSRQLYMLSSLGLFYLILIALFAIPLLGSFVVILIKGAFDLRYFIIAGGFIGLAVVGYFAIKALKRLRYVLKRSGFEAGNTMRCHQLMGQPVEISILGGLLKFTAGQPQSGENLALPHQGPSLLPRRTERDATTDIVCQLQGLSELKRAGSIDADEFNLLKAVLIEASAPAPMPKQNDRGMWEKPPGT